MRVLFTFLFLFSSSISNNVNAQITANNSVNNIAPFKWVYRVVLIRTTDKCEEKTQQLHARKLDINERHVIWFVFCEQDKNNELFSNYTQPISPSFFNNVNKKYFDKKKYNVVLIGKDGKVKSWSKELALNTLFSLIDSMPMRQSEILEQQILFYE